MNIDPFEESREDFRHYYHNCWVKVHKKNLVEGEFYIACIHDLDRGRKEVIADVLVQSKDGRYETHVERIPIKDNIFDFSIPDLGMCNFSNTCAYVSLIPRRQYKKGFDTDSRVSFPYISESYLAGIPREMDNYYDFVWDIYHRKPFLSIQEAFESFKKNIVSRALSPSFAISLSTQVKEVLLFYKLSCIGYIKDSGEVVMGEAIKKFPHILDKFNSEVKK